MFGMHKQPLSSDIFTLNNDRIQTAFLCIPDAH